MKRACKGILFVGCLTDSSNSSARRCRDADDDMLTGLESFRLDGVFGEPPKIRENIN